MFDSQNRGGNTARGKLRARYGLVGFALMSVLALTVSGGAGFVLSASANPQPTPVVVVPDGFATRYADEIHGSDNNSCGKTIETPCKSIGQATDHGKPTSFGDGTPLRNDIRVFVAPGFYALTKNIDHGYELIGTGSSPADVVIAPREHGEPGEGPMIDNHAAATKKQVFTNVTFVGSERRAAISSGGSMISFSHVVFNNNPGGAFDGDGTTTADHVVVTGNGGGGFVVSQPTTITDSIFSGNTAIRGGAIRSKGALRVERTAIFNNSAAGEGGGIHASGDLTILNSTIANNRGEASAGGILLDGANVHLVNSTISGNTAKVGAGISDSIYENIQSVVSVQNTIIAGNSDGASGAGDPDCRFQPHSASLIIDDGHNIIGNGDSCHVVQNSTTGTRVGTTTKVLDARLEPLANNGGGTFTMADNPSSPGWAAGDGATCVNVIGGLDQRNVARGTATRGTCDIGAYDTAIDTPPSPARVGALAITNAIAISWDPPTNYALPISTYAVRCLPNCGAVNVAAPNLTYRWAGLTVGQSYQFTVQALSGVGGPGIVSAPSTLVQFQTSPGLVSNLVATSNGTSIDLSWNEPTTGGGVLNYAVICSVRVTLNDPNGVPTLCDSQNSFRPGLDLPMATTLHLTNAPVGVTIQFSVFAQNIVGSGYAIQSNPVTIGADPGIPTIQLEPADDTGPSNRDNVTAKKTLRLFGTADAGSSVNIREGSTVLASALSGPTGLWSAQPLAFDDGVHQVVATVTRNQITTSSLPLDLIVDSLKPFSTVVSASVLRPNEIQVGWNRLTTTIAPIDHWEVTALPEGTITSVLGSQNSVILTGFSPGSTHTFSVLAITRAGVRGFSATSSGVTMPAALSITKLSVTSGPAHGYNNLVITGTGLQYSKAVFFGQTRAFSYADSTDGTTLTVTAPPGMGTVNVSVSDAVSTTNAGPQSQYTYVVDSTPPVITVPAPIVVPATSPTGATITYVATANDEVDGVRPVTCIPASGAEFPIGDTTVSCTAADASKNRGTASFLVSVTSPGAVPTVSSLTSSVTLKGAKLNISATGTASGSGATIASAKALLDSATGAGSAMTGAFGTPAVDVSATLDISSLTEGNHTVYVQVTNSFGRVSPTVNRVFMVDRTAPILSLPADVFATVTSVGTAPVSFVVSATDAIDGALQPNCSPASGTLFNLGPTTVSCSATDAAGNVATGTFTVTVGANDVAPKIAGVRSPTLTRAPVLNVEATSRAVAAGATMTSARAWVDGLSDSSVPMGGRFGRTTVGMSATLTISSLSDGPHTLTIEVFDSAQRSAKVTTNFVVDRTAPTLAPVVTPSPVVQGRPASVEPNATDAGSGVARTRCGRVSTQNVGTQTVTCTAVDRAGNEATATGEYAVTATTPAADLMVFLQVDAAQLNSSVPVSLKAENQGPSASGVTTLTFTFDPNSFAVANLGGAIQNGNTLTWTTNSLGAGRNLIVRATLRAIKLGATEVTASVTSSAADPNTANNTIKRTVTVQ